MTTPTPKGEKMTAEQRADKIADLAEQVLFSDVPDDSCTVQAVEGRNLLQKTIAAEIKAAEDAAYADGICEEFRINRDSVKEAYAIGFAEAVEKAAKICRDDRHDCPAWCARCEAADEIQALRPSGSGEEKLK